MKNKDRTFEEVVRSIAASESDVDKILAAARLERNEGPNRHMTGKEKYDLLLLLIIILGVLGFFCIMFVLAR